MPANPGVIGAEPLMDAYGYMIPFVLVKNGGGGKPPTHRCSKVISSVCYLSFRNPDRLSMR